MQPLAVALPQAAPPNSTPAQRAAAPSVCPLCGSLGIQGWKTPRHYPLAEVQFCQCPAGRAAEAAERAKAAERASAKLAAAFTAAGIPAHFRGFTIETLVAAAGDDPDKARAIEVAQALVQTGLYAGKRGAFFFGPYGSGKTGLLTPVLRHYLDQGHSGLWIEYADFCSEIQRKYGQGDEADKALDLVRSVDWLLMDDVGDAARSGQETDDKRKLLYQIVNSRHDHMRPMLLTSNLSPDQFANQFGARTFERVLESCAIVKIAGRNLRRG